MIEEEDEEVYRRRIQLACICKHPVERHHFSSVEHDALPCLDCPCEHYVLERRLWDFPVVVERRRSRGVSGA